MGVSVLIYDGVPFESLNEHLGVSHLQVLETTTSVMDVAADVGDHDVCDGRVVLANHQTTGRGRQGREWKSPRGRGIWLAVIRVGGPDLATGPLALRAGLAVIATLEEFGADARLKWPNDVMLTDRKVCGILCEARRAGERTRLVIGVGINVSGPAPQVSGLTAVSLSEAEIHVDRVEVLKTLIPRLQKLSSKPKLDSPEQRKLDRVDWLKGRRITSPVTGVVGTVDEEGALVVETPTGVERVWGGHVVVA